MKKILILVLFLAVIIFCMPMPALGATMIMNVTVSNVRVPERSAMALATDLPNTEFKFDSSNRVIVVRAGTTGTVSATKGTATITGVGTNFTTMFSKYDYIYANTERQYITAVNSDTSMTLNDNWASTFSNITYSVRGTQVGTLGAVTAGDGIIQQGATTTFAFPYDPTKAPYGVYIELAADKPNGNVVCKADCTPVNAGNDIWTLNSRTYYKGNSNYASCPYSACNYGGNASNYGTQLAVSPSNVVYDMVLTSNWHWWRSPLLFTITAN